MGRIWRHDGSQMSSGDTVETRFAEELSCTFTSFASQEALIPARGMR